MSRESDENDEDDEAPTRFFGECCGEETIERERDRMGDHGG
jgi:hypothetical protein